MLRFSSLSIFVNDTTSRFFSRLLFAEECYSAEMQIHPQCAHFRLLFITSCELLKSEPILLHKDLELWHVKEAEVRMFS
jgi:hypothetical protein